MKAILLLDNLFSNVIASWWTPLFVGVFAVIVIFAFWPTNRPHFDEAAHIPLRKED